MLKSEEGLIFKRVRGVTTKTSRPQVDIPGRHICRKPLAQTSEGSLSYT